VLDEHCGRRDRGGTNQRGADARVRTGAECHVPLRIAPQIQPVRNWESLRIAVCGGQHQGHAVAGFDLRAAEFQVFGCAPELRMRRPGIPQELFDGDRHRLGRIAQHLRLFGIAQQRQPGIRQKTGQRLRQCNKSLEMKRGMRSNDPLRQFTRGFSGAIELGGGGKNLGGKSNCASTLATDGKQMHCGLFGPRLCQLAHYIHRALPREGGHRPQLGKLFHRGQNHRRTLGSRSGVLLAAHFIRGEPRIVQRPHHIPVRRHDPGVHRGIEPRLHGFNIIYDVV